jgi:hypothetical protein
MVYVSTHIDYETDTVEVTADALDDWQTSGLRVTSIRGGGAQEPVTITVPHDGGSVTVKQADVPFLLQELSKLL